MCIASHEHSLAVLDGQATNNHLGIGVLETMDELNNEAAAEGNNAN